MNKEEAKRQVNILAASIRTAQGDLDKLQAIIDAPEPAPSLLTKPEPGSGDEYWWLEGRVTTPLGISRCAAVSDDPIYYRHGNIFQTSELAEAYADAIETMLLLRHQPGTVPASDGGQWLLGLHVQPGGPVQVKAEAWAGAVYKAGQLSPCFDTREHAQAALDAIGADRIERMFKTFHHIS